MSPRLPNTKWLLLLVCYSCTIWKVHSVQLQPAPPPAPQKVVAPRIEDQAKFFQDFFSVQLSPYKIEFGHVCEDPNTWEQRYEKKDFKNHRDMGKTVFAFLIRLLRYMHAPTAEDYDQGHRQGTEQHFTERHEKYRPATGLFSAKVRWGDKQGGYGEHYWDLNHAGHSDDHGHGNGDDNGYDNDHSYNDSDDSYDEPSDTAPQYENSEESNYDEDPKYDNDDGNRNKRAHIKTKTRKEGNKEKEQEKYEQDEEHLQAASSQNIDKIKYDNDSNKHRHRHFRIKQKKPAHKPEHEVEDTESKNKERLQTDYTHNVEKVTEHIEDRPKPKRRRLRVRSHGEAKENNIKEKPKVKEHITEDEEEQYEQKYVPYDEAVRQHKEQNYKQKYVTQEQKPAPELRQQEQQTYEEKYVPYEHGSGVRQHQDPELQVAAASVPRLFWEPSTGHVVDRATGQAYVLQPIQPIQIN